ncbi:hypothetical protein PC115_g23009 [Phytophthora cactorum]|uniref:Aldolase-type TIM barrel n=1 Tax=Phytophthora cactorum TaxID=29920 RepID=A0A8T1AET4_9STRA|nr:hypothetical protein PC115_g23009 [Phytophthora cactorum]
MARKVWFQLLIVDAATRGPFVDHKVSSVPCDGINDIEDLRNKIHAKYDHTRPHGTDILSRFTADQLGVYANRAAYDEENSQPLKASASVDDLGNDDDCGSASGRAPMVRDKNLLDKLNLYGILPMPRGGRDRPHSGEAKKYKSESKVRVEAKNALDNYAYNLRNSLNGEKLKEKTPEADKKAVVDKVPEALQWLDANQAAEKEEFESGPPDSAEGRTSTAEASENRAQLIFEVVDVVLSSLPLSQVGIRLSPVTETFGCKDSAPRETYGYDLVYLSVVERRGIHADNAGVSTNGVAHHFRSIYNGVLNTAAGIDHAGAMQIVEDGAADLVALVGTSSRTRT